MNHWANRFSNPEQYNQPYSGDLLFKNYNVMQLDRDDEQRGIK